MTAAEHYAEAEKLLTEAEDLSGGGATTATFVAQMLAAAQVHATLATAGEVTS